MLDETNSKTTMLDENMYMDENYKNDEIFG